VASTDDFRVVAGTAAPIIALANTVLVQPGLEGAFTFHRSAAVAQEGHARARARRLSRVVTYGSVLNLGAQVFVLLFVLFSLSPAFAIKLGPVAQVLIVIAETYGLMVPGRPARPESSARTCASRWVPARATKTRPGIRQRHLDAVHAADPAFPLLRPSGQEGQARWIGTDPRGKRQAEIHHQALMILAHEIFDPETSRRVLVDHAIIVAGGEITKAARAWLGNVLDASRRSQILFMDRDDILNLYVVLRLSLPAAAHPTLKTESMGSKR
jgi:hypothetical protein